MTVSSVDVRAGLASASARSDVLVISAWTGRHADTLRRALSMSQESFAEHLGIAVRTVAYWRQRPESNPQQHMQQILHATLERASADESQRFAQLLAKAPDAPGGTQRPDPPVANGTDRDGAAVSADSGHAATLLADLADADMADRADVTQAGWLTGTAPSVITGYLFSSPAWHLGEPLASAPSTAAERIRATVQHLMDMDFQFGGGYVRRMLLFYFQSEVVPLLRERHPLMIRREIFSAAAEVAELLGWSAYDAGRHGIAQRYFTQGLRLAAEAEDPVLGGRVLSSLSHQASYLGRYDEALQFARAAQASGRGRASDSVMAMFLAMEARALASQGEPTLCASVLNRAEQAYGRRDPSKDPLWIGYFDEFELSGEAAHCFRELGESRQTQVFAAKAIDPVATPARTRGFIGVVHAAGALGAGNLDEALAHATSAVGLTSSLQSSRYVRYLMDFHDSLMQKHSANPAVRQFTELLVRSHPGLQLHAIP